MKVMSYIQEVIAPLYRRLNIHLDKKAEQVMKILDKALRGERKTRLFEYDC